MMLPAVEEEIDGRNRNGRQKKKVEQWKRAQRGRGSLVHYVPGQVFLLSAMRANFACKPNPRRHCTSDLANLLDNLKQEDRIHNDNHNPSKPVCCEVSHYEIG